MSGYAHLEVERTAARCCLEVWVCTRSPVNQQDDYMKYSTNVRKENASMRVEEREST